MFKNCNTQKEMQIPNLEFIITYFQSNSSTRRKEFGIHYELNTNEYWTPTSNSISSNGMKCVLNICLQLLWLLEYLNLNHIQQIYVKVDHKTHHRLVDTRTLLDGWHIYQGHNTSIGDEMNVEQYPLCHQKQLEHSK